MQTLITELMARDQTRYRTPSPPPFANQENMEEDENTPVTRRELAHILKGKGEASEPTWEISPPFGHHILAKPYPKGYQPPTFRKFDGTGSAKEHILSFLDDLGVFRNHQELKIKEFSKSLTGRVFTWYCKLKASSINTWEQLVTEFCNKFLEEEPSMHIMDLGRVKQRQGEGLVTFVKRYRDQALLCIDTLPEPQLVYGCIRNMEDGSQIYLSMSNINTFFELLKRASDITEAMKRNGRRYKEVSPLEVCAADGRGRRSSYSKGVKKNSPPPPLPLSRAQAMVVVNGWFEDGTLNPRTDREPPTSEDLRDPRYCMVYRNKGHGLTDYYVVRTMFHRQVKEWKILLNGEQNQEGLKSTPFPQHDVGMIGVEEEVMLTEIVDEAEEMVTMEESLDEDTLTRGLLKSRGCRIMFNQLGLEPHIQKEVARALIGVIQKHEKGFGGINAQLTRLAKAHANALVFRDPDSFNGEFYHNKPLYVEAVVEGMKVRRALVDAGSGVNIIPTHIFLEMGGSTDQIRPTQVGLNAFNGVGVKSRGYVNAVLEVGPIKTNNKFHVVDGSSSYHILLGRPWIHLHRCVPSSWHQCIKSSWRGKDISISATVTPFDAGEAHLVDASFYEELALPGVNKIRPVQECTIGTPRQKAIRKDTLMEEAPKENTKKRATSIEDLGLRKEILPGGGYRWCIL
ncbi:hypothetical protein Ahy_B03g063092 [Arachis hypogaea]|uniref:Retrotransposon gag domain-containing protein n=1 Tax=Arachis hypogaea TaxID=3818 RepID=A0A444ZWC1_ARAHY|nr:hypothetical protein Ahy_B03g063092 [Arachis hypogaea]